MTKTTNYGFIKSADDDFADIAVLDANFDAIDTDLHNVEAKIDAVTSITNSEIDAMFV